METKNNNQHTGLLVMDVQGATVKMLKDTEAFFQNLKEAIQTARKNKIPVLYVVVGFRKGYPEASFNNKSFARLKTANANFDTPEAAKVAEMVAPQEGEIIITKKRVSAFCGSDLEVVLRAMEIKHLVLTGIATSGVVLSTLREAADKDYTLSVIADCCADMDDEVHRVLTTKIFPKQADVYTAVEWCAKVNA